MLEDYQLDRDRHIQTAKGVLKRLNRTEEEFGGMDTVRQLAKRVNFLTIYGGQGSALQTKVQEDLGLTLGINLCQQIVDAFFAKHVVFAAWQDELVHRAKTDGYIELPTGWTRWFSQGYSAESYICEIKNFPCQGLAVQFFQSAQFAILCEMHRRQLRSIVGLQIHDSLWPDIYPGEREIVHDIFHRHITRPPIMPLLEDHYGRSVPIKYECKRRA
jgi:DNA polymerase I-like protein with 3'-5' exonuclease and polymerase domains